jgi:hypothetical protein
MVARAIFRTDDDFISRCEGMSAKGAFCAQKGGALVYKGSADHGSCNWG